jgi:hypothetical protein
VRFDIEGHVIGHHFVICLDGRFWTDEGPVSTAVGCLR